MEAEFGVTSSNDLMPNGETRFRLKQNSGSGYIYTVSGNKGGWQNSHSHQYVTELYAAEAGWFGLATFEQGKLNVLRFYEGNVIQVDPGVPHNVYLPYGSRIHTLKIGSKTIDDWTAEPELDKLVKDLSEPELIEISTVKA